MHINGDLWPRCSFGIDVIDRQGPSRIPPFPQYVQIDNLERALKKDYDGSTDVIGQGSLMSSPARPRQGQRFEIPTIAKMRSRHRGKLVNAHYFGARASVSFAISENDAGTIHRRRRYSAGTAISSPSSGTSRLSNISFGQTWMKFRRSSLQCCSSAAVSWLPVSSRWRSRRPSSCVM